MKYLKPIVIFMALISFIACKDNKKTEEVVEEVEVEEVKTPESTTKKMTINLSPKSDSNVEGTVTFQESDGTVSMTANMTGLTEGSHAIHIHQTADCSSADGKSTGGHWNPTAQPHGKWGDEAGYHKGDIGNFEVAADGVGTVEFSTDQWCIGCGDETKDIVGKAVIVHQGTDDFTSQPSGAAGARVSCAGIIE
ncbi:Cu-Zn family superoxide dismutase [Winogradskyella wandonensis]|uniref:Cu-Zn family superoxide dismutase n=1 Tax=Winogradskyella wandonensis TaxID=1442586 RepID=A0A4R1KUJ2_9FLAO|nr:superoxide dismutase family protein [Winogradskyella wandonensis]TCK68866.1 Cu-Zn family superoxide dismutase [Winogradskyella wandonensis]